jgi:ubiquinone/menaquinone biosynthesis C-methylase UbiE
MGLYGQWLLPRLIDLAMRNQQALRYREKLVPRAAGRVLEIGAGSGHNLPFYGRSVRYLYAVDPSAPLMDMARDKRPRDFPVELLERSAEELPLASGSIDTVVSTWTLCSIPDAPKALREARRVLAPGGTLLFVEHGHSPDPGVAAWQRRLDPLWSRIAGGCHLDRPIARLIRDAGFELVELDNEYLRGPRPFTYTYSGVARPGG